MHLSSPVRTPKLQLAAEQPLTGECWISPKTDTPHTRAKEQLQQDGSVQFSCLVISNSLQPHKPQHTRPPCPLGWTDWISLKSKGLSRVFSNTTVQKHQFFGAQLSL